MLKYRRFLPTIRPRLSHCLRRRYPCLTFPGHVSPLTKRCDSCFAASEKKKKVDWERDENRMIAVLGSHCGDLLPPPAIQNRSFAQLSSPPCQPRVVRNETPGLEVGTSGRGTFVNVFEMPCADMYFKAHAQHAISRPLHALTLCISIPQATAAAWGQFALAVRTFITGVRRRLQTVKDMRLASWSLGLSARRVFIMFNY